MSTKFILCIILTYSSVCVRGYSDSDISLHNSFTMLRNDDVICATQIKALYEECRHTIKVIK